MMNSDYVSLLSVQLSLLVMKLSYRMQTGRMQCKLCTNAVQNLSNEVLTYPTKRCTNLNLKKEYIRAKPENEKRKHVNNQ